MPGIECKIINSVLFTGSSDTFRSAIGGYWQEVSTDDGTEITFDEATETDLLYPYFDRVYLSASQEVIDKNAIMTNRKIAVRVVSDGDEVNTDEDWKRIWLGGTYGEKTYEGVYSEQQLNYTNFNYYKPYPYLAATLLTTAYDPVSIQISYTYNNYLREYETYQLSNANMSELMLPNYYLMADLARWDFETDNSASDLYPTEMLNYLSREDNISFELSQFFDNDSSPLDRTPVPAEWEISDGAMAKIYNKLSIEYLTSSYVQNSLSASTENWASTKMKNILFDASAVNHAKTYTDYYPSLDTKLPYSVNIDFTAALPDTFTQTIVDSGYDSEFIRSLYQTFSNKTENIQPNSTSYNRIANYYSASITGDTVSTISETSTVSYREVDYLQMLANSYNAPTLDDEEYMFVGPRTIQREAAKSDSKVYRYANTQPVLSVMKALNDYISTNTDETKINSWEDLYSDKVRHMETVAYRVQKVGGPASGDTNTQSALQNFWFLNNKSPLVEEGTEEPFKFVDSQVKYGAGYHYTVFAYVLTVGIRYNFSDLALSRHLGCEDDEDKVGLEFYNPQTGERTDRLLTDDITESSSDFVALEGTFLNASNVFSSFPYAADFYLNYEPEVKIVEIPIYDKTVMVMDSPPNEMVITPYGVEGSQQEIGFNILRGVFSSRTYPTPVTENDQGVKDNYLHSNDLTDSMKLTKSTISNPTEIIVYRMTTKPQKIEDFQYSAYDSIITKIPQEKYAIYGATQYHDKISANTNYYYLFKSINEHDMQSHLSPVIEARIVYDGGYSYAIFNTIQESELEQKIFTNPTKHFKNLIQLQPNLNQIQLNTSDVDFSNSAASEISNVSIGSADDLIWDKTFKVRLTSKKTGKKIDFNITYNLNSE